MVLCVIVDNRVSTDLEASFQITKLDEVKAAAEAFIQVSRKSIEHCLFSDVIFISPPSLLITR